MAEQIFALLKQYQSAFDLHRKKFAQLEASINATCLPATSLPNPFPYLQAAVVKS